MSSLSVSALEGWFAAEYGAWHGRPRLQADSGAMEERITSE